MRKNFVRNVSGLPRRLTIGLVPVLLAGAGLFASPAPAMAGGDFAETATTTYRLDVAANRVDVTSLISIKNNKKSSAIYDYYWPGWYVAVPLQAGAVKVTANKGTVTQSPYKTTATSRILLMNFARLFYRETRVLTVTYAIPAGPKAPGDFRALRGFVRLCAQGVGIDSGILNVQVPSGFDVRFIAGKTLTRTGEADGYQTLSSGSVPAAAKVSSCLEGVNPSGLSSARTSTTPVFDVQAWPEDSGWADTVATQAPDLAKKLEDLTGVSLPAGPIVIREAGRSSLGEYANTSGSQPIEVVTDDVTPASLAHGLAHVLFNDGVFAREWMAEGFASYSEKIAGAGYKPCGDPGPWPTSGFVEMDEWVKLSIDSTPQDMAVAAWQKAAACYLVTSLADAMGPDGFKAVAGAAVRGEIAYVGSGEPEQSPADGPLTADELLDVIDERGMVPGGVTDLDQAQNLFSRFGLIVSTDLNARSAARARYHALASTAAGWKLPYAIRGPMASWKFDQATAAMDTASQILSLRDRVVAAVPAVSLDSSDIRMAFEGARSQDDLDGALALTKKEADAADKTASAISLNNDARSFFQTIGLLGSDPATDIGVAKVALAAARTDEASAAAQRTIDMIDGAANQGMLRLGAVVVLLLILGFGVAIVRFRRRLEAAEETLSAAAGDAPARSTGRLAD